MLFMIPPCTLPRSNNVQSASWNPGDSEDVTDLVSREGRGGALDNREELPEGHQGGVLPPDTRQGKGQYSSRDVLGGEQ